MNDKVKMITSKIKKTLRYRETTLILMLVLMFLIIPFFKPTFISTANILSTLLSVSLKGIIGIGVTLILISGGLDLSVGAMVALISALFGSVYLSTGNLFLSIVAALAAGILCGAVNGVLITRFKLSAFIATLAAMGIFRGVTYVLTKGTPIKLTVLPESYRMLGQGKLFGIQYIIYIFVILTIITHVLLKKSKVLRKNVYTGSNEKAARFSGINTGQVIFFTYIALGILCWLSAQLSLGRFLTASPTYGVGWETELIAAAVIGGATLTGGEGSIIGTTLGLILLGFVSSAIVLLGVSVYWQDLISNMILLLAVLLDVFVERRKVK